MGHRREVSAGHPTWAPPAASVQGWHRPPAGMGRLATPELEDSSEAGVVFTLAEDKSQFWMGPCSPTRVGAQGTLAPQLDWRFCCHSG